VATRDNRVREVRHARGLTLNRLAAVADISPNTLVAVEKHFYWPTERVRERIAAALGLELEDLWPRRTAPAA